MCWSPIVAKEPYKKKEDIQVMPTLEDALLIAVKGHKGKRDKAGEPYILHPLRVMIQMDSEEEKIVAILHDVIEDTSCSIEDLRRSGYKEEILEALDAVTRREKESYPRFIKRASKNPLARRVKKADLEDNMNLSRLKELTQRDLKRTLKYHRALNFINTAIALA